MIKKVSTMGFEVLDMPYREARTFFDQGSVITISPNTYGLATKNQKLYKSLQNSNILVLDGVYFGLGYFLKRGRTIFRNQGPEVFYQELEIQKRRNGRVFFLGSSKSTLDLISRRMKRCYPQIEYDILSPPFKEVFDKMDNSIIENKIKDFQPDVVFVGMTCPKQEIWIDENISNYDNIIFIAIGGVFDWFAGNYNELHPIWWKLRLGWLGRILQRPEILRRNFPNIIIYLKDMLISLKSK